MKSNTVLDKRVIGGFLFSALFQLSPSTLMAKQPVVNNLTGYPMMLGLASGDNSYSFKEIDQASLNKMYLDVLSEFSNKDRDYMAATIKALDGSIQAFLTDNVRYGLTELSDTSLQPNGAIALNTFISARRNYLASVESIKAKIISLTAFPEVGAVNNRSVVIQGDKVVVDGTVKADFAGLKSAYQEILGKIETEMESKDFRIIDPNGSIAIEQKGLVNLDPRLLNPYTIEQINAMSDESARLRITPFLLQRQVDTTINLNATKTMQSMIEDFGKSETSRSSTGANYTDLKEKSLKQLNDFMFSRSLIRIMYGVKTGTPGISYKKQEFNWDFFKSSNDIKFSTESILDKDIQRKILTDINEAIRTQKYRAGVEPGFLSVVMHAINWLKGEESTSKMNVLILTVLARDIEEDLALDAVGGLRDLKSKFIARYYNTPENEKYYRQKKLEVLAIVEPAQVSQSQDDDGFGDVRSSNNTDVATLTFAGKAFQELRRRLNRADELEAVVAQYDSRSKQTQDTAKRLKGI